MDVDIDGMCGIMSGAFVLFVHNEMIDRAYFDEIFKTFIDSGVRKYIRIGEKT